MATVLVFLAAMCAAGLAAAIRARQIYRRDGYWAFLVTRTPWQDRTFADADLDHLPPPARLWLGWAAAETTALRPVAVVASSRQSALAPGALSCRQVLAFPHGAVWRLRWKQLGLPAALSLSTDKPGAAGTAWHAGLLPGRRAGSIASQSLLIAQCAAEAALWTPAAMACARGVTFEQRDPSTVSARWNVEDRDMQLRIEIAPDGEPRRLTITSGAVKLIATPSEFEDHEGVRIPRAIGFEVSAGEEPAPFSSARLEAIRPLGPFIGHSHA